MTTCAYVTRLFDLMRRAGIGVIGYGSGGSRWVPDGFPRQRALAQVRDFLHLCADLGEPRGVKVALEPYNRDDANLLNTVPEALEVVSLRLASRWPRHPEKARKCLFLLIRPTHSA